MADDTPTPRPPGWNKDRSVATPVPPPRSGDAELTVGLYCQVPMLQWFQSAITAAWQKVQPGVALTFVDYDCYSADPPATLDVFAFDAIFASYFVQQQYLQAFPTDTSDFFDWSLAGLSVNSDTLWAVPYLGCMNILIYRNDDPELGAQDLTVDGLLNILGPGPTTSIWPAPGAGLLIDFSGGTTDACLYLQVAMQNSGQYPLEPVLPQCPGGLDGPTMGNLQTAVKVAGPLQARHVDSGYERLNKFVSNSSGRAFAGLTENFHFFPEDPTTTYTFRPLPLAGRPATTIPLYADALAVNRAIDPAKLSLAIQLVELIASPAVTLASFSPQGCATPQCLTPVRPSVLHALAAQWPLYSEIAWRLGNNADVAFRMGAASRPWLNANKSCIRSQILGPGAELLDDSPAQVPGYASTPAGLWRKD
jgi:thiamine pyridinylase